MCSDEYTTVVYNYFIVQVQIKGPPNVVSTGQVCMQHHTIYSIYYVQVELDPELAKNENWIFSQEN